MSTPETKEVEEEEGSQLVSVEEGEDFDPPLSLKTQILIILNGKKKKTLLLRICLLLLKKKK
jgi:hypothetical protein